MSASLSPVLAAGLRLIASNVFMTFAWYGHLRHFSASPWYLAVLFPVPELDVRSGGWSR